jgi:phosphomannomutase
LKEVEVRRKDGVKLVFQNGAWLLVRTSGAEPLLRLYAEAPSKKELERILNDGEKACKAALSR